MSNERAYDENGNVRPADERFLPKPKKATPSKGKDK